MEPQGRNDFRAAGVCLQKRRLFKQKPTAAAPRKRLAGRRMLSEPLPLGQGLWGERAKLEV